MNPYLWSLYEALGNSLECLGLGLTAAAQRIRRCPDCGGSRYYTKDCRNA